MKNTIFLLLFFSVSLFTFSQSKPYFKESLLYLTLGNGVVGLDNQ